MEYKIKLKRKKRFPLFESWTWKMAWKDARNHWSRLFLFISSIIIGIAALVAINSFNRNLTEAIDGQARGLMGADLEIDADTPFEEELVALFDSIPAEQADEVSMASMVSFKTSNPGARLVKLNAWEGSFPFYGEVELEPADALDKMRSGRYAMVDENLAVQYEVSPGDSVKIGDIHFEISGVVKKIPGGGQVQATFTPAVYISKEYLDETGLVQFGSRLNYKKFFKTESTEEVDEIIEAVEPVLRKYGHHYDTVEEKREDFGEALANLYKFFNLLSFVALILGCIGVASSVHIYTREKTNDVAVLRCLGASGNQVFNLYMVQIMLFGFIGSLIGTVLGVLTQYLLPLFFGHIIPVELELNVQWVPIAEGLLIGLFIAVIFSLLPLINVRYIPPLSVIRQSVSAKDKGKWLKIALYGFAIVFLYLFAVFQTRDWLVAGGFLGGLLVAFAGLYFLGKAAIWIAGRLVRRVKNFTWRQAFSNLFRPQNQTVTLVVVIGLGGFLLATLEVVQDSLIDQVESVGGKNSSNTILFDIQPYQAEQVKELTKEYNLPVNQFVPIVTMRVKSLKGRTVEEIQKDTTDDISNWSLTREYRVTYRDSLKMNEELVKGRVQHVSGDSVFITLSERIQDNLEVEIGDSITFDVQGRPMTVYVGGFRDFEWQQDPPNFLVVFPPGVLEEAPQIYVLTTTIENPQLATQYQRELVASYPNVSLIDLRLVLRTLQDFFGKVSFIIRFMALFSLLTGLVVLAGSVINSKFGRLRENVLLRTMGAVNKQIIGLTVIEYAYLGILAGATGIFFSILAGELLSIYLFEMPFGFDVLSLIYIWLAVIGLTVVIGWWNTRDVTSESPLAVLRRT
ncbi:MAG: ABC transporter permease [Candidatus Cyclobacteriaceae bacterium M2_1C_046]